ncbi:MAG: aldo/keto reductase [Candidatus Saganbacteria bacterium]|nr:aldo/keto reductase [Candidatus Saganbacteria bacterium]
MSKIALGTAQFGLDYGINNKRGKIPQAEIFEILDLASQNGIDMLDTAPAYGGSQEIIGEYQAAHGSRFNVVSKLSKGSFPDIQKAIDGILTEIRAKTLYGLIYHSIDDFKANEDSWKTLEDNKANGRIKKIGFSLYTPRELEYLFEKSVRFDLVQVPYSIFDQRFKKYFKVLKERNVEVHVRSVFLQGLFFMDANKLDPFFLGIKNELEHLREITDELKISMVDLCLGFALMNNSADMVVAGVDGINNLREIISALTNLDAIKNIYEKLLDLEIDDEKFLLPFNWKLCAKGAI